jgi:hypothetical protein
MTDGRCATMSWTNIDKTFKRIKEDMYKIPPLQEKLCQDLYVAAAANATEVKLRIKQSQSDFLAQLRESKTAQTNQPSPAIRLQIVVHSL